MYIYNYFYIIYKNVQISSMTIEIRAVIFLDYRLKSDTPKLFMNLQFRMRSMELRHIENEEKCLGNCLFLHKNI